MQQINGAFTVSFAEDTFDAQVQMLHNLRDITMDITYWKEQPDAGPAGAMSPVTGTYVIGPVRGDDVLLLPYYNGATLRAIVVPITNLIHIQYC